MDDLGKHLDPTLARRTASTTPNPPIRLTVWRLNERFEYDNGSGDVNVLRRTIAPERFPIHFERRTGETWIFKGWTWKPMGNAPVETPRKQPVLEVIDVADDLIKVSDRVAYDGPHRYEFTILIEDEKKVEHKLDPEIENRREPGRSVGP